MAGKKPRTPEPPRRAQAPKQRAAARGGSDPARRKLVLYGGAGALAVAAVVGLFVVFAGGGSSAAGRPRAIAGAMRAAGCTLTTTKAAPSAQHIQKLTDPVTYSSYPPVSGKHYYVWALWGNYTEPVDPRQAVHDEEHGGVVVWVGPKVSDAQRRLIDDFYDSSPNALLVTPIEDATKGITFPAHTPPGSTIYLTAWTVQIKNGSIVNGKNVVASCPRFDRRAFAAFRDEFRGKGPERYPVSTLKPGT